MSHRLLGLFASGATTAPAAPTFVSAEVGLVNATTVATTFSVNIAAASNDFTTGITIKNGGVSQAISAGVQQTNHAIIYYTIPTVANGDTVTIEYDATTGHITESTGITPLATFIAQAVTNNVVPLVLPRVASATLLLDLRASQLVLSEGDPVSTWADASGNGRNFTQTGSARPTYRAGGGVPYVQGDGIDDWMLGPDFADGLTDFAVFAVYDTSLSSATALISKITTIGDGQGWLISPNNTVIFQESGGIHWIGKGPSPLISTKHVYASLISGGWASSNLKVYRDGVETPAYNPSGAGLIAAIANTEPVRLFTDAIDGDYFDAPLYALLIYAPAPNLTDMAAISTWLMAQNGIVNAAPLFVSAETHSDAAVDITFSHLMTAATTFPPGVTIKVNGTPSAILAASTPGDKHIVEYELAPSSINSGDVVTWEYSASTGVTMSYTSGLFLADVSAQPVTNNN